MKFIWIDDEPEREVDATNLQEELGVKVEFRGVNEKEIEEEVEKIIEGEEPDLIILDHFLSQRASTHFFQTGSTLAFFLHERWPSCPIVCVTNAEIRKVYNRQQEAYEEIFQGNKIGDNHQKILSIAEGFYKIKNSNIEGLDDLVKLLQPPSDEKEKIKKILPTEIKENVNDVGLASEFYHWMNTIFLQRPGFLYDKLWAATYLGLSEVGFDKIKEKFNGAMYNGIFCSVQRELWWKCKLTSVLGYIIEDVGLPWVIGRQLIDGDTDLYSKCAISDEEYPETVASLDDSLTTIWHPMKLKYTETHPNFENMLFFEEMRMQKIH